MTCFWQGIINALKDKILLLHNSAVSNKLKSLTPQQTILILKKYSTPTIDVLWNDQPLSNKQYDENMQRIETLNINTINQGYDCSTCEPFLLLISQLFCVNIEHDYNGSLVTYTNIQNKDNYLIKFKSNKGHFWKI